MGLEGLDVVFGLGAPAVDLLIEGASAASGEIGDDVAGIGAFLARLDASDDPLDAAPARRGVEELLEAGFPVRLINGFAHTKETPTSLPTAHQPTRPPPVSYPAGQELRWRANENFTTSGRRNERSIRR